MIPRPSLAVWVLFLMSFATQNTSVRGVKLCGARLADVLQHICVRNGGFHSPKGRRTAPFGFVPRSVLFRMLKTRRDHGSSVPLEISAPEEGVVNECCRKECSWATLSSYCAKPDASLILEGLMSPPLRDNSSPRVDTQGTEQLQQQMQEMPSATATDLEAGVGASPLEADSDQPERPSLGIFNRNRPVFIVVPQIEQPEDPNIGKYKF